MKKKLRYMGAPLPQIITAAVFLLILFGLLAANLLRTPDEVSRSERRTLAQFPEFSFARVASAGFMADFEKYTLDQFVARDSFRTLKSYALFYAFGQKDNHGLYPVGDVLSKYEALRKESFLSGIGKIQRIQEQYLAGLTTYFALVPEKNYYIAEKSGHPSFDYAWIEETAAAIDATHIDLAPAMGIGDFYRTDLHWSQPRLQGVLNTLGEAMGFRVDLSDYTEHALFPFYGAYAGQSALHIAPDTLTYLTNGNMENTRVTILDENTLTFREAPMYDETRFSGVDPYDVYLRGAVPLVVLENTGVISDRELILFRDSFGSSIAPLLTGSYRKITLVDLRYIASPLLGEYVDFHEGADVLFLLSASILNNSETLLVQ